MSRNPARGTEGYTHRFEYRPEFLFGNLIKKVIDAEVPERTVNGFRVAKAEDVFADYTETFLVFGKPNITLVTPSVNGISYQKFGAYSLWRKKSDIQDITRNSITILQSGIWVRFSDLPPHGRKLIRESMDKMNGKKFRTCVNGCMHVLESAGFSSKNRKLSSITWPYQLMNVIFRDGLEFDGKPVTLEVIRTTRMSMEEYTRSIILAEIMTPYRHIVRHPAGEKADKALRSFFQLFRGKSVGKPRTDKEIAPALPTDRNYKNDIRIRVTSAPLPGQMLRQIWGPHALFEAIIDRVKVDDHFTKALKPFPQKNPGILTQIKKTVLFSRPIIWLMRKIMGTSNLQDIGTHNERDVYDMLRTHSGNSENKYNIIVVRMPQNRPGESPHGRLIISRITVRNKFIDWVLSKHVLMSGYLWSPDEEEGRPDMTKPFVVWAGEIWKNPDGELIFDGNSGTYRPTEKEDAGTESFLRAAFPNLKIKKFSK